MDIVLPVPDYLPDGADSVELIIPKWMLDIIDKEREPIGQSREDYLYDIVYDELSG